MEEIHFHTLRHTHESRLLMQGVPLKVASAGASHATAGVTADVCGRLLPGADEQAAAQLNTLPTATRAAMAEAEASS
jgi:integrase